MTTWTTISAQSEMPSTKTDSLNRGTILSPEVIRLQNGFLLDLNLMLHQAPAIPNFKLEVPNASKDYNHLFRLDPSITYSQGTTHFGWNTYGFYGSPTTLQSSSFQLKNGIRLNTYGQYNKDGYKVPDPSALPWQRDNFKSAFELKSQDGSFGVRIEVEHGRKTPF